MGVFLARCLALLAAACALPAVAQFPPPNIDRAIPGASGERVVVDGNAMLAFVANATLDRVTMLDQTGVIGTFPTGKTPRYMAYGGDGRVFVSNEGDQTLTIRTPTSLTHLPIGGSGPIVVSGDKVYVLRQGNNGEVAVVDTRTSSWYAIDTGSHTPHSMAIVGTRLFVSHTLSGDVRSIDLTSTSDHPPTVSIQVAGQPGPIASGANNKVYVLSDDARGPIVEIDATTNVATPITMPGHGVGPRVVKASASTVFAGFANELVLMDIRTRNLTFIPTAEVRAIDYDFISGLAFVLDAANNLRIIDDRTGRVDLVPIGSPSSDLKFIYKLCEAYVAGSTALTLVHIPCGDISPSGINAQALWWVPEESGWGLNIAHQGGILFGTWFTYDAQGQPMWLVMSNGVQVNRNSYAGTLYRTTGPAFNAPAFDASKVTRTAVGELRVDLSSLNAASVTAIVDGVTIRKSISKQVFASPAPTCGPDVTAGALPNYQDLWWNPAESGWGLNIAHQGDILFITWFTYDTDGRGLWLVGSDVRKTGNATYSGTLYRTAGPPVSASPWDPSKVARIPAGSATLTFANDNSGTFAYTVNGITGTKAITRQVFATPVTRCR